MITKNLRRKDVYKEKLLEEYKRGQTEGAPFSPALVKEPRCVVKRVLTDGGDRWVETNINELFELTIGDLASGAKRLVFEVGFDNRKLFLVTKEKDLLSIKQSNAEAIVLYLPQVIALFDADLKPAELKNVLLSVLMFEGATLERVSYD